MARTALTWGGVVAFPVVLALAIVNGHSPENALGIPLRYLLPVLAMTLPATVLRRQPLVTIALMLAGATTLTLAAHSPEIGYLTDLRYLELAAIGLAVGAAAARQPRRVSLPVGAATLAVLVTLEFVDPIRADPIGRSATPILAIVAAWVIGHSVRTRRRYADELRAQAAEQAITAERLRIARELHDMVAHSIGVIAIQAGMGSRVIDTQPAEARTALRSIEATSRETLAGLRRVVGRLREAAAPLAPAASLADLDQLVTRTAAAGVRVDLRWRGARRALPADLELSAYRIVQEAVTNVVRHAGTPECRVIIEYRDDELRVEITDDGRGGVGGPAGYGIAGMRERVALLDGAFDAGPRPGGGFRVAATLPTLASVAPPASVEAR